MNTIYRSHNYLNKDYSILRSIVREYDLREGGFSLIKEYSLLPQSTIDFIINNYPEKMDRTIYIGKLMQTNSQLVKDLMNSFIDIRKRFCEANNIENEDVLSIKKDALFIIEKQCKNLQLSDNILFVMKNKYSSYLNISGKEFYYSLWTDKLDIKGVSKEVKNNKLFDYIKSIIKINELNNRDKLFTELQKFRYNYLTYKLPIECYKELNNDERYIAYKLKDKLSSQFIYLEDINDKFKDIENIDIAYNFNVFILPLISALI